MVTGRLRAALIALIGVGAFILAGSVVPSARAAPTDGTLSVLVMGDSYSAGNGAGDYYGPAGCRRSRHNYGEELVGILRTQPFTRDVFTIGTIACSGDTTASITGSRQGRPPQVNAVGAGHDVVFLTLGGNDLKFSAIVKFCLIARFRDGANCNPLLDDAQKALIGGAFKKKLVGALAAIRARMNPSATIVLVGYPYLEGDPDYTLRSGHGGSVFIKVGARLRQIGDFGDKVQQSAAAELNATPGARVVFVKTKKLFAGPPSHELYANKNNPRRWFVQPFVDAPLVKKDLFYHPNQAGWRQVALLLSRTPGVPTTDSPPLSSLQAIYQDQAPELNNPKPLASVPLLPATFAPGVRAVGARPIVRDGGAALIRILGPATCRQRRFQDGGPALRELWWERLRIGAILRRSPNVGDPEPRSCDANTFVETLYGEGPAFSVKVTDHLGNEQGVLRPGVGVGDLLPEIYPAPSGWAPVGYRYGQRSWHGLGGDSVSALMDESGNVTRLSVAFNRSDVKGAPSTKSG